MNIPEIIQILNYVFIGLLVLGALIGFKRGIFKSVYNLIVFLGLLVVGLVLSSNVANIILTTDVNMNIGDVYVTNLKDSLPALVASINPDLENLVVEGSEVYTVALEIFSMISKMVFIIIWLLLMFTIFKFIFWIIYLIVKPRKRDENGKRVKKTFSSRLIGGLIGACHISLLILIFCIPVAGVCSLGNQLMALEANDAEEVTYTAIPTNDGKVALLSNNVKELETEAEENYFSIYRESSFGKFCGMIKIDGVGVDEKLFDQMFTFEYNATEVHLVTELAVVTNIYKELNEETGGEITLENILAIKSERLYEIVDEMATLDLISVAIPVGAEFLLNSESFNSQYGELLENINAKDLVENLKATDFNKDISNLGKGFVDIAKSGILSALNSEEDTSLFEMLASIDEATFEEACKKIGDVELLNLFGEVGLGYIVKSPAIQKYVEAAGITIEDINIDNIKFGDEIASLGGIVSAVKHLGLENAEDLDLSNIEDEKINELIDALYEVDLFNKNTKLVVSVVKEELLPEDYKDILPAKEMNATDLKAVARVAKSLISATSSEEGEGLDINELLSEENIKAFEEEGAKSEFLKEVVDGAGKLMVDIICDSFGIAESEINLDGVVWVDELRGFKNVLNACEKLGIDLTGMSGESIDIANFTNEQIDEFASAVFSSKFMKQNTNVLLTVIKQAAGEELETYIPKQLNSKDELVSFIKLARTIMKNSSESGFDITNIDSEELADALSGMDSESLNGLISGIVEGSGAIKDTSNLNIPEIDLSTEEGKAELKQTIEAMETISELEDITSIKDLTTEQITSITSSKVASSIVAGVLVEQTQAGGALSGFISTEGISDEEWADNENGDGELKKLLDAAAVLMDDNGSVNLNTSTITGLTEEDIVTITSSKVITNSLENNLNNYIEETVSSTFGDQYDFELNLGEVKASDGQTTQEAWAEEITTIKEVVTVTENLDEIDLSDAETANKVGELLNTSKDSQILGDATIDIATTVLNEAYSGIDGHDAPVVTETTDFIAEFAKLQELLNK